MSLSLFDITAEYSLQSIYQSQFFIGIDTGISAGIGIGGFAGIKSGWSWQRGLRTNVFFNKGIGNRGFLDVLDRTNGIIYDFKFGDAVMSSAQFAKYSRNFELPIQIIKP